MMFQRISLHRLYTPRVAISRQTGKKRGCALPPAGVYAWAIGRYRSLAGYSARIFSTNSSRRAIRERTVASCRRESERKTNRATEPSAPRPRAGTRVAGTTGLIPSTRRPTTRRAFADSRSQTPERFPSDGCVADFLRVRWSWRRPHPRRIGKTRPPPPPHCLGPAMNINVTAYRQGQIGGSELLFCGQDGIELKSGWYRGEVRTV